MARIEPPAIPRRLARPGAGPLLVALLVTAGCQGGGDGPLGRWRTVRDDGLAKPLTDAEKGTASGTLLGRLFRPTPPESKAGEVGSGLVLGSDGWRPLKPPPSDPETEAQFKAAEARFQEGKLADAEAGFQAIAKARKGSNWGEKAQFYLAQTQFQRGKLVAAHKNYEKLIATYPGTQFLEKAVKAEYAIADEWLAAVDPKAKPEKALSFRSWWAGRHPAFDTSGGALAALEHVRHHDPFGPLADDAVMRIADYHYGVQNWDDAALHYDQLIADHPKSPLLEEAHRRSIDAKIKGYLGPEYDGAGLEQARALALHTLTLFPERQASHSDEVYKTVALVDEQMTERAYKVGEHYLWTGKVASAEYSFGEIPVKWPKSPYAAKAKEQLAKIAKMPRKQTRASTILTLPGSTDPSSMSSGGMGMNGMGMGGMTPGMGGGPMGGAPIGGP